MEHRLPNQRVSAAAVVRYAGSFLDGTRKRLNRSLFSDAPESVLESHEHFMAVRNKHVAHSLSPYEENYVLLDVPADCRSSAELASVRVQLGRVRGLETEEGPRRLQELSLWLRARVIEEIAIERQRLLEHLQGLPLTEILAYQKEPVLGKIGAAKKTRRHP